MTIIQMAERLRAQIARKGKDLVRSESGEFDLARIAEIRSTTDAKSLNVKDEFEIVEVPSLTVSQYLVITLLVTILATVAGGLAVLWLAKALGL